MITFDTWIFNIRDSLEKLSDLDFQLQAWVKGTKFSGGWYEEVSTLYDSHCFEEFLSKHKDSDKLPNEAYLKLLEFHNHMDDYDGKENDADIVNDPVWKKITLIGKEAIAIMDKFNIKGKLD